MRHWVRRYRAQGLPGLAVRKPKAVRYEHANPGDLVHIDVKKLGRIPDGGGWRTLGRAAGRKNKSKNTPVGHAFLHSTIDDHSRVVYSKISTNEKQETATEFWGRANAYYESLDITVKRDLCDNGSCYRSKLFNTALSTVVHEYTRPYRPQTNGKIERFHRTPAFEWAGPRTNLRSHVCPAGRKSTIVGSSTSSDILLTRSKNGGISLNDQYSELRDHVCRVADASAEERASKARAAVRDVRGHGSIPRIGCPLSVMGGLLANALRGPARLVVMPRKPVLITVYDAPAEGVVRLQATEDTLRPGTFGLWMEGALGQFRIGRVVGEDTAAKTVDRALTGIGWGAPRPGRGEWKRDVYDTPASAGLPYSEVAVSTPAGDCPAWLVGDPASSNVWVIHLHGIRTDRTAVLPSVAAVASLDVVSLIPTWRGDIGATSTLNGASSLGDAEWADADAALNYAVLNGAASVIIVGWSMGANIALRLPVDSQHRAKIIGLALIAPATDWRQIIRHAAKTAHLPRFIGTAIAHVLSSRRGAEVVGLAAPIDFDRLDWLKTKGQVTVPTLLIHNHADPVVPSSLSMTFTRLNQEHVEAVYLADAPHAMEWNTDPLPFNETLVGWMTKQLGRAAV